MTGPFASPNFNGRDGAVVDMLVIHYTGMRTGKDALARLCDPAAEVSAHYFLDADGVLVQLVDEADRAWHAGVASWRGQSNINSRSIGIELVNPGHEYGYQDFPEVQMGVLIELCGKILARHPIPARNVVGHSDVAPARKQDPGERFDWARLAEEGIGLWPQPGDIPPIDEAAIGGALAEIGYDVEDLGAAVTAFQRHFHPTRIDGIADVETRQCIAALSALL